MSALAPAGTGGREGEHVAQPPDRRPRRARAGAFWIALVAVAGAIAIVPGARAAEAPDRQRLGEFLWGLAGQESGWDYYARNRTSGAFGKYQIMPANWPSWAARFLGDRWADQTPRNQELVARAKVTGLYRWLGTFRRVAYWWLTGDTERRVSRWSESARRYVRNVMALMRRAPRGGTPPPPTPADGGPPVQAGDWRLVGIDSVLRREPRATSGGLGPIRDWTIVRVERTTYGSGEPLWLRVQTADDRVGWLKWRRTLPAARPVHPERWKHAGEDGGDRDGRSRARPRPR
jgi:hypothetical protein